MEIHQLLPSLQYGDAIGNHAIGIRNSLRSWGFASEIFVEGAHEKVAHLCRDFGEHPGRSASENILIYHHCIGGTEAFKYFLSAQDRRVVIYHNITPASYFAPFNSELERAARQGREELRLLREVVYRAWGDSPYNCDEMIDLGFQDARVLPIAVDFEDLDAVEPNPYVMDFYDGDYENLLFVGRISPNKRQDQIIRFFDHYQKEIQPKSRLFLVGGYGGMESYCNHLLQLMGEKKATNIIVSGHIHLSELVAYYRLADVFVCLSEHEGFCVPLLESMHFGVPIVALDSTGVAATLGDAGVKVKESSETSVAFAVRSLLEDKQRLEDTVETQRRRLRDFDKEKIDIILRDYVEEITANA